MKNIIIFFIFFILSNSVVAQYQIIVRGFPSESPQFTSSTGTVYFQIGDYVWNCKNSSFYKKLFQNTLPNFVSYEVTLPDETHIWKFKKIINKSDLSKTFTHTADLDETRGVYMDPNRYHYAVHSSAEINITKIFASINAEHSENDYMCPQDLVLRIENDMQNGIYSFQGLDKSLTLLVSTDNEKFFYFKTIPEGTKSFVIPFGDLFARVKENRFYFKIKDSDFEWDFENKKYFRFFDNTSIDKSKLYVLNDTLFLPKLSSTQSITMSNMKIGHFDTIRNSTQNQEKFVLDNKYGYYNLKVQEKKINAL